MGLEHLARLTSRTLQGLHSDSPRTVLMEGVQNTGIEIEGGKNGFTQVKCEWLVTMKQRNRACKEEKIKE